MRPRATFQLGTAISTLPTIRGSRLPGCSNFCAPCPPHLTQHSPHYPVPAYSFRKRKEARGSPDGGPLYSASDEKPGPVPAPRGWAFVMPSCLMPPSPHLSTPGSLAYSPALAAPLGPACVLVTARMACPRSVTETGFDRPKALSPVNSSSVLPGLCPVTNTHGTCASTARSATRVCGPARHQHVEDDRRDLPPAVPGVGRHPSSPLAARRAAYSRASTIAPSVLRTAVSVHDEHDRAVRFIGHLLLPTAGPPGEADALMEPTYSLASEN